MWTLCVGRSCAETSRAVLEVPCEQSFQTFLTTAQSNWSKLPDPEKNWLLSSLRLITQVDKPTPEDYDAWYQENKDKITFNAEKRRFEPGGPADAKDKNPK